MNYEIGLFDHNAWAYEKVREELKEKDKTCIVHATGTGKSFIALQLIYDFIKENPNNKVAFLTPLNGIKEQLKEHIDAIEQYNKERGIDFHREYFDNVEFITYASAGSKARDANDLDMMSRDELSHINADLLILDEFHHLGKGAENWKAGVDLIIESNPNIKVFGMSATNIRNRGKKNEEDVAETFFEGNIASEYPIEQAIADGILPAPNYHAALISLEDECAELEENVRSGNASIEEKEEYEKILRDIRKKIASIGEETVQDIISKHIKKDGKYIYFCPNGAKIKELQKNFIDMLPNEMRDNVEFYQVHSSKYTTKTNKEMANNFYNNITSDGKSSEGKLRVMFAINMYNEDIHVPDIDGVIMGRNTQSDIIFYQQLGRALAVKKKSDNDKSESEPPLVIDLQDNFRKILKLYREVNHRESKTSDNNTEQKTTNGIRELFYSFGMSDEIIDILEEIDKVKGFVNDSLGFKAMLNQVKAFMDKEGRLPKYKTIEETDTKEQTEIKKAENKLATWLYKNSDELPLLAKRQDSEKHEFSKYEEEYVIIAQEIESKRNKFKAMLKQVKAFMDKEGRLPKRHKTKDYTPTRDEKSLGDWLAHNNSEIQFLAKRQDSKKHPFSEYEEEYIIIAQEIEAKIKENNPDTNFKTRLKQVKAFMDKEGRLPKFNTIEKMDNEEQEKRRKAENRLAKWLYKNSNELPFLAKRQDSEKHKFSRYEEEYIIIAQEIEEEKKESKEKKESRRNKFKACLKQVKAFMDKEGRLPKYNATKDYTPTRDEKSLSDWLVHNSSEIQFLAKRQDSEKHKFSEYEEEYVLIAQEIESKRNKFKTRLNQVKAFMDKEGRLPKFNTIEKMDNEEQEERRKTENKLYKWLAHNRKALSMLAKRQDSEKHKFSEYEEEYVLIAQEISILRGWITLEETKTEVPNEQILSEASDKIINGKLKEKKVVKGGNYIKKLYYFDKPTLKYIKKYRCK